MAKNVVIFERERMNTTSEQFKISHETETAVSGGKFVCFDLDAWWVHFCEMWRDLETEDVQSEEIKS